MPMSVDEYQIGQLYTIQKKSRLESTGAGSGVEIIENKPFQTENEQGQYTLKVYHVDERLPSSLKTISKLLFPKSALLFEEESWNSYPYTRTKYRHKLFKSFSIDIESKYLPDYGQSENAFNISKKDQSVRIVDHIDIVNDQINPNEYNLVEDPGKFQSKYGPLGENWLNELKTNADQKTNLSTINNQKVRYMCAYKLCRVECAFWGFQSKVEKLIVESVLRNMILMSHRQAWCWQDEYMNLSMDDVRRLELETQEYLNKKMKGQLTDADDTLGKIVNGDKKEDYEEFLSQDENISENEIINNSTIKNEPNESNEIYINDSDFADIEDDNQSQNSNLDEFYDAVSINSNLNLTENKKISSSKAEKRQLSLKVTKKKLTKSITSSTSSLISYKVKSKCKFDTLILVVHGGNVTCTDTSKQNDFSIFKSTMESVIKDNYGHIFNKIAFRLVSCNPICQDALLKLSM